MLANQCLEYLVVCSFYCSAKSVNPTSTKEEEYSSEGNWQRMQNEFQCKLTVKVVRPHGWAPFLAWTSTLSCGSVSESMFTVFLCLDRDRFEVFVQTLFEQIVFNVQLLLTGYVHRVYTEIWGGGREREWMGEGEGLIIIVSSLACLAASSASAR